ncbi:hypothetical protein [Arthrobacter sp. UYEF3]|uniref:hypothetical protein n=1 Tax=Arthrobacter sp. UYEF3 TaxID=1756365 RepID=UPI003394575C
MRIRVDRIDRRLELVRSGLVPAQAPAHSCRKTDAMSSSALGAPTGSGSMADADSRAITGGP